MISATLIINAFLHSSRTDKVYDELINTARRHGIDMTLRTNADYMVCIDCNKIIPAPDSSDFILFWNKDITLGKALEKMGYRLFNSAQSIYLCDDKSLTTSALSGIVPMPKTIRIPMTFEGIGYNEFDFLDVIAGELGYPFVIKECFGSYGGQVYLATDKQKAVEILKNVNRLECIAQEYISQSFGRDLRVYVVGNQAVAAIERNNANDFRANISNGGTAKKYKISDTQAEMAIKATKALGLDFAGVDLMFLEDDEPILCEVNSNAQFIGLQEATGINVTDYIFEHIKNTI